MAIEIAKAHAYGNDFLYVEAEHLDDVEWTAMARRLCDRHTGVGADGLILFQTGSVRPRMRLLNADGSPSEISGNGARGLAALLAWRQQQAGLGIAPDVEIDTDAGTKHLTLLEHHATRFTFRASMGAPSEIQQTTLDVGGEAVRVVTLRVGNPQCVVLETRLDEARYRRLGPLLEHHPAFPEGTNVSFAQVTAADRVEILIWERGVGPTLSSGTGSCGAAVAAMQFGGCARNVEVVAPGGTQRVAWTASGLELTGWAEVSWIGRWVGPAKASQ